MSDPKHQRRHISKIREIVSSCENQYQEISALIESSPRIPHRSFTAMTVGDLDDSGREDVVLDFGSGIGVRLHGFLVWGYWSHYKTPLVVKAKVR